MKAYSSSLKRLKSNLSIPACSTRKRSVSRYIAKRITILNESIEREQKSCQEPHIRVSSSPSAYHTAPGCVSLMLMLGPLPQIASNLGIENVNKAQRKEAYGLQHNI